MTTTVWARRTLATAAVAATLVAVAALPASARTTRAIGTGISQSWAGSDAVANCQAAGGTAGSDFVYTRTGPNTVQASVSCVIQ